MNGNWQALRSNAKLVGLDGTTPEDTNGKEFGNAILAQAETNGKGIPEYKWLSYSDTEIEPKTVLFEKADNMVLSSAYYRA